MRNFISPALLFLLFHPFTFSQSFKPDTEKMKMTGAVKKIYENSYQIIEDSGLLKKGTLAGIVEANFTPEGYLAEEIINDKEWHPVIKIRYTYDDHHRLTRKDIENPLGFALTFVDYKYDSIKNEVKEAESYVSNVAKSRTISKYDIQGKLIHQSFKDFTDKNNSCEIDFSYDEKGNLVQVKRIFSKNTISSETMEYDDHDNLIKKNFYNNNELVLFIEYRYVLDHLMNWTKQYEIASIPGWDQAFFRERNISYY
jgi:hypothetical protein